MVPSYSIFIVAFVMFSGLVSGLPNVDRLGIRSDSISQTNSEYLSARSTRTPLSRYGRRGIFGAKPPPPGIKCDGTFYKQSRVELVATKACNNAAKFYGLTPTSNPLSKTFKQPLVFFPDHELFPLETEKLIMIRITKEFFSFQRLRTFLRLGKRDYILFASNCRSVGVVRQLSENKFVVCNGVNGGNAEYKVSYD